MRYFPLFLDLRDRRVVIVGGGVVAERKFALLAGSGADIRLVAPTVTAGLAVALAREKMQHLSGEFAPSQLESARLVIAATDDPACNRAIALAAEARGIIVNVVDDLELSSGILPAIIDRSPLVVAVSTEGTAPVLARLVRERIEAALDESLGELAAFLGSWRGRIKAALPQLSARRRLYDWLLRGPVAAALRAGRPADGEDSSAPRSPRAPKRRQARSRSSERVPATRGS